LRPPPPLAPGGRQIKDMPSDLAGLLRGRERGEEALFPQNIGPILFPGRVANWYIRGQ